MAAALNGGLNSTVALATELELWRQFGNMAWVPCAVHCLTKLLFHADFTHFFCGSTDLYPEFDPIHKP